MNKPQEIADHIIMAAYKNDGGIEYDKVEHAVIKELLPEVNGILKDHGTLFLELSDYTWYSYHLSNNGSVFASRGAFRGLDAERDRNARDRRLDIAYKRACIVAVVISFLSLILSIIAIRIAI